MLKRLRLRITWLASLLTGAVLSAALLFSFAVARRQFLDSRRAAFETAVSQLQYQWERFDVLEDSWLRELEAQNDMRVLLTENGRTLLYSLRADDDASAVFDTAGAVAAADFGIDAAAPPLAGVAGQSADFAFRAGGTDYLCAVRLTGAASGRWTGIVAVQNRTAERAYTLRLAALFLLAAAAGWAGLSLVCWFVAGRAVRPVGRAMDEQQRFLSDAGHELRTPLAVIRANAGAALRQPEQSRKYLEVIDTESCRMGALVDELLLLSAGASARTRLRLAPLEPDTFLLDFAESMEPLAQRRGRRLTVSLPEHAAPAVDADAYRLRQLLAVLVDNALRFAPKGSAVELRLCAKGGRVRFCVTDHGPGVPDKDKRRIFERFVGSGADDGARHYGLGLAVAAELASLHGGKLWAEDAPGGGAAFFLELPARRA